MSSSPADNREYKRKRVSKACESCRSMKSKCDGSRPACNRCVGYGYACVYRAHPPRVRTQRPSSANDEAHQRMPELCNAIQQQEALLERVISMLPDSTEQSISRAQCSRVKRLLEKALSTPIAASVGDPPTAIVSCRSGSEQTTKSPSYLGEVSDVRFFNLVKHVLQAQEKPEGSQKDFDSYDQEDAMPSSTPVLQRGVQAPGLDAAESYIEAYFSTIHLAYPFIPKPTFLKSCPIVRARDTGQNNTGDIELAITYTIYAIGAYYVSFPGGTNDSNTLHENYYVRSLVLSSVAGTERSLDQVSLLLARCFYLLAVCKTECCWATLGQAIRVAQSIGLHVEHESSQRLMGHERLETERRRRVWYSLYVLDRLLSLQLGRPPAIHDDDYAVSLPSRVSDLEPSWDGDNLDNQHDGPLAGDYFLAVIAFSCIVGRVLRGLYCPRRPHIAADGAVSTKNLDQQLLKWKASLPRLLRFDLGHAFDKSYIFRRQRNMLAVKYHHLRALIHRPYLCYPALRHTDNPDTGLTPADWPFVSAHEKTCIMEARETARLLHGITSEKDLVYSFPWWQMISCLVCAGSILLVSSIFAEAVSDASTEFDTAGLYDDAETCLKVFDALSNNSAGARIARDMMKALKEYGSKWGGDASTHGHTTFGSSSGASHSQSWVPLLGDFSHAESSQKQGQCLSFEELAPHLWPAEIMDSMTWSAQFLDTTQEKRDSSLRVAHSGESDPII